MDKPSRKAAKECSPGRKALGQLQRREPVPQGRQKLALDGDEGWSSVSNALTTGKSTSSTRPYNCPTQAKCRLKWATPELGNEKPYDKTDKPD